MCGLLSAKIGARTAICDNGFFRELTEALPRGDTHAREHLNSWKTLMPCAKDEEALVDFLRSPHSTYLVPFRAEPAVAPAAAA